MSKLSPSLFSIGSLRRGCAAWGWVLLGLLAAVAARAQTTTSESFTGTSASGWTFGAASGSTTPYLTAGVVPGDTAGNGWLRLTEATNNQATYALWDNSIFSVNAQIQIEMEYTFWNGHDIGGAQNGKGADGMTFFLVDASKTAGTFQPGAYGGSLGYAQLDSDANGSVDKSGMPGGYLGFGFDNWGNYAGATEGRVGGVGTQQANGSTQGYPNRIAVRGPDDGDGNNATGWEFIKASAPLDTLSGGGQMDFPTATTRPDQTGADYRSFRLTLDANNQLTVEMKFGTSGTYITVFTADLSTYDRPDYFKLGFTAGTGGANEIHEIRNLSVTMTPWQPDAFEWDNSAGGTKTWSTASNWVGDVVPGTNADILFGNMPTTGMNQTVTLNDANKKVNSITFDSGFNYTINTTASGSLVMGDTAVAGLPSINVNDYNGAQAQHHINVPITMAEELKINNYSFSTLCLNGAITTGGNDIKVNGTGAINFNADIIGSGSLIKNGSGLTTINNNNADSTAWTGNVTINNGMVVVTADGALGGTISSTNNLTRASGNTTIRLTDANAAAAGVKIGQIVTGTNIPAGTYITGISSSSGNTTITLSQALTGALSNTATVTFAGATWVNDGGALAFRDATTAQTGLSYTTNETVFIAGRGVARGSEGQTGAIYNDGGNNSFSGNIYLTANAAVGSRDGVLTLSGAIGQSGGTYALTKLGEGVVSLTGANTYGGATIIEGGVLRVTASSLPGGYATAAPSGGNLTLAGGVLEIADATTFTRQLGAAADQVQWTGDGGFSAFGANRTVTLTNSGGTAGGQLTWNAGSFVPTGNALVLSSKYSNAMVTMTNAIALGAAQREVRVANGSATVDATLSGNLTGTGGGLLKTGEGTLNLTGTNTYTGATEIRAGALRGNVSGSSNIQLSGGVRELAANYTGALGTTGGLIQWVAGGGGLAADSANRTFNVGNNAQTLTWGGSSGNSQYFVRSGDQLVLGSRSSSATLTFANAIDLNGTNRTIKMQDGTAATDAILSGALSNGSLTVVGAGRLASTAANTLAGTITVKGAELRLQGAGTAASVTGITVRDGGAFTLDNSGTNNTNRLGDTATVELNGGTFSFLGAAATSSETVGALTLAGGANTIDVQRNGTNSAQLTLASLTRNAGSAVNFTNAAGGGTLGTSGTNPRVMFTTAPTLSTSGVLGYATVNGTNFAGYGANGIAAVTGTNTAQTSWTSSINAATTADVTLTAARTVGSLALASGIDVNGGGFALTVDSGGILSTGATTTIISNGTIRAGTGVTDLVAHVYNTSTNGLEISAVIADNSGAKNFVKTGDGVLMLTGSAANTFTGTTYVNAGTLALNKTAGVNAIAGNIVVGDGRGTDKLRLDADEQIANSANLTLRGSAYGTGETVLQFNGASGVGVTETLGTLTIDGVAVIDFAGGNVCDANFLFLDDLLMATPDSMLYIRNWVDFTDFLLVKNTANLDAVFSQIKFEGYGDQAYWESYDSTYSRITPVPEPSTYGAMFVAGAAGLYIWRRRRQQKAAH